MISSSQYLVDLALKGKRLDDRKADEFRKIEVETGLIEKANGSALVRLGSTKVLVGIKMDVKEPFPDKLNEGVLMAGAELSPLASPDFDPGPPREESIELARVVDRPIRESHAIDTKKLCIVEGEKVWVVSIDIQVLDAGGNLIDTASLAAMAALLDTKLPKYENDKVLYSEMTNKKLPIVHKALSVTSVKLGKELFVDPSFQEEAASTARVTVGTRDDGSIVSLQKGGTEGLTLKELDHIFELGIKKGKDLRKLLK